MRRCTEADRALLLDYLGQRAALNLFFIGDIENSGFDTDCVSVYADIDSSGVHAVDLVYRANLCLMSYEQKTDPDFVDVLIARHRIAVVSGDPALLAHYRLPDFSHREDCRLARLDALVNAPDTAAVVPLGMADLPAVTRLHQLCFPDSLNDPEEQRLTLTNHSGRLYGIFADGRLASVAGSTAECSTLAMAIGVATDPACRGRGYAAACIAKLSAALLAEGKTPCLFYDNPSAARIYKALGYRDIGDWSLLINPAAVDVGL